MIAEDGKFTYDQRKSITHFRFTSFVHRRRVHRFNITYICFICTYLTFFFHFFFSRFFILCAHFTIQLRYDYRALNRIFFFPFNILFLFYHLLLLFHFRTLTLPNCKFSQFKHSNWVEIKRKKTIEYQRVLICEKV